MLLNEKDIRSLILNPEMKEAIKRLMLTDNHIETLRFVSDKGVTSSELAAHQGTIVQAASQLLKNIYAKGYLLRKELKAASGAIEYAYWVKDEYLPYLESMEGSL